MNIYLAERDGVKEDVEMNMENEQKLRASVVYSFNEGYAKIAMTSIVSLLKNNSDELNIDLHILGEDLSVQTENKIMSIANDYEQRVTFEDTSHISSQLEEVGVRKFGRDKGFSASNIVYYRFFAPQLISDNVDRIIYIGGDTLVTGSIMPMLTFDLGGKTIGMVADGVRCEYKKVVGLNTSDIYYNDDIAIINVSRWREKKLTDHIIDYIKANGTDNLPLFSQDLYNIAIREEICKIPPHFAWLSQFWLYDIEGIYRVYGLDSHTFYDKSTFEDARKQITIHHFCGNTFIRPWYKNSKHPMASVYKEYWDLLENGEMGGYKCPIHYRIQYFLFKHAPRFVNDSLSESRAV